MIGTATIEHRRSTLAALLGTNATLASARHELIVALVADPRRLEAVTHARLATVSNAAQALDAAIVDALRDASEDKAAVTEIAAELARRCVDDRLLEEGGS